MNVPFGPILIVEDNPNVLELLEVTLRFKGYPVVTAVNGQDALEKAAKERPALIITDILMPRMDGYSLAHNIRKNPLTAKIPIIFISATYITPEDKAFALSLGAVRFIEKPIDAEDFLLTVAEILTQGIATVPRPMEDTKFYQGYRERLENKLRYKNTQIARTERLLQNLPPEQKPAFEALLAQAIHDRDDIQNELDQLYRILGQQ
ncbi:MAG TPA: response regulator [Anaerolineaceae bacterium]|jgi:CheY-like chemotaxis protein|nr:response regulator [Longilinea sp.]HNS37603.1 response regulator [Anaerolineaceae bacterium]HQF63634.1 response regulator [Anaerolineaceae bacterium]HQH86682.1 response regulator [Anaerolineaceae bacterium]HQN44166.1 response regulator [Anaerolineaceae bacterium]